MARTKRISGNLLVLIASFLLAATLCRAEWPGTSDPGPDTSVRGDKTGSGKTRAATLRLTSAREIVAELEGLGLFQPAPAFYAGHMGKTYVAAMAVVSREQQYMKMGNQDKYLDPTTEAHESLHAMSSLIRRARGWSIGQGYDVIYVGNGQFASVRVCPGITKGQVAAWLPRHARDSEIVKTHLNTPSFKKSNVALIVEELAYHLLDGKIGLENHSYMEKKLGISNAVTAPVAEWSVVALAAATMLDEDPNGFRRREDRIEFNLLIKRLVEESVNVYARGMNGAKYGLLANLSPELRSHFTFLLTEDSKQARAIRDFAARAYGNDWLPKLVDQVETAREASESSLSEAIRKY